MPVWYETIKLGDLWTADIPFERKRDLIVDRVKCSKWYKDAQKSTFEGGLLYIVQDLSTSASISEFDVWFNELYDRADIDRIWIETF